MASRSSHRSGQFYPEKKTECENILELFYGYEVFFISHAVYTESFIILIKISLRLQFNAIIQEALVITREARVRSMKGVGGILLEGISFSK